MALGTGGAALLLSQSAPLWMAISCAGAGSLAMGLWGELKKERQKVGQQARQFEAFEHATQSRYSELQETKQRIEARYQELLLLEEAAGKILRNNALSEILGSTLDGVCKQFGFDRAFAMLVDAERRKLQTAAIAGIQGELAPLWQFQVHLEDSQKNPLAVSSVYRTGVPVLISDVSDHFDRMNESSRKLIHLFGVHRFMVVPIPGQQGNWGVLLADRGKEGSLLNSDLELLGRVARQLGLALDKHSALEAERQRAALFRKFVPAYERSELMQRADVHLGWELRETVAMFVDIRGYTETTGALPPHAIAALVNGFYGLVHRKGREHGGYTDKFIGDAALVTWGYLEPLSESFDGGAPVQCAVEILAGVEELNRQYQLQGIPPIQIGIGIHRGPAVCGLFGCDDRMDFTGVGSTANTASRLQTLSKELKAVICISENVIRATGGEKIRGWSFKDQVQLRGVKEAIRVAYLPREGTGKSGGVA